MNKITPGIYELVSSHIEGLKKSEKKFGKEEDYHLIDGWDDKDKPNPVDTGAKVTDKEMVPDSKPISPENAMSD